MVSDDDVVLVRSVLAPLLDDAQVGPSWASIEEQLRTTQPPGIRASSKRGLFYALGVGVAVLAVGLVPLLVLRGEPDGGPIQDPTDSGPVGASAQEPLSWTALPESPLSSRHGHSVVWTGADFIVWGGSPDSGSFLADGAAYSPAAGSWRMIAPAPIEGRLWHSAVWTGREMLIWGGTGNTDGLLAAAYEPKSDTWRVIAEAPIGDRAWGHTTTWTGDEMIVWGNRAFGSDEALGAAYNPETDTWREIANVDLGNRVWSTAVWTGGELIVWGGEVAPDTDDGTLSYADDGAAYDPVRDVWRPVSAAPLAGRFQHTGVWTGSGMIVWGGARADGVGDGLADGALYDPVSDMWEPIPTGPLTPRSLHAAVWTGSQLLVWGGSERTSGATWLEHADGAVFDPYRSTWARTPLAPATGTVTSTPSAWTGSELIHWGLGDNLTTVTGAALGVNAEQPPTTPSTTIATTASTTTPSQPATSIIPGFPFAEPVALRIYTTNGSVGGMEAALIDLSEGTSTIYPFSSQVAPEHQDGAVFTLDSLFLWTHEPAARVYSGGLDHADLELRPENVRMLSGIAPSLRVVPSPGADQVWVVQPGHRYGDVDRPTLVDLFALPSGRHIDSFELDGDAFPVGATDRGLVLSAGEVVEINAGWVPKPEMQRVVVLGTSGRMTDLGTGSPLAVGKGIIAMEVCASSCELQLFSSDGTDLGMVDKPFPGTWISLGGPGIPSEAMPLAAVAPSGGDLLVGLADSLDVNSVPNRTVLYRVEPASRTTHEVLAVDTYAPLATWSTDGVWVAVVGDEDVLLVDPYQPDRQMLIEGVIPPDHFPLAAG